jgi:hypothetical protein
MILIRAKILHLAVDNINALTVVSDVYLAPKKSSCWNCFGRTYELEQIPKLVSSSKSQLAYTNGRVINEINNLSKNLLF